MSIHTHIWIIFSIFKAGWNFAKLWAHKERLIEKVRNINWRVPYPIPNPVCYHKASN